MADTSAAVVAQEIGKLLATYEASLNDRRAGAASGAGQPLLGSLLICRTRMPFAGSFTNDGLFGRERLELFLFQRSCINLCEGNSFVYHVSFSKGTCHQLEELR